MSHNFQLQLIRKALTELGYAEVADFLVQRIASNSDQVEAPPGPIDPVPELIQRGDYPALSALLEGEYDTKTTGGKEKHQNPPENTAFAELSENERSVAHYLVLRTAFLERVLLVALNGGPNSETSSPFEFLQSHVSPSFDAIDRQTANTPFVAQLTKERESSVLVPLALAPPARDQLEEALFTPKVLLTHVKTPFAARHDDHSLVARLRHVLISVLRDAVDFPKSGATSAELLGTVDIPDNCLADIIDKATRYNETRALYHLPPRKERPGLLAGPATAACINLEIASRESLPIHVLHTISHHTDEVWYTRFLPLGRFLATGSLDGTCLIYDVTENFRLVAELDPTPLDEASVFAADSYVPPLDKKKGVIYFSWEPYERYLVTCCLDTVIRVWDVENITQRRRVTRSMSLPKGTLFCCFTLGERMRTWPCEFLKYDKSATPHFVVGSPDKVLKVYSIEGKEVLDFYSDADEWLSILGEDSPQPGLQSSDTHASTLALRRALNHSHSSFDELAATSTGSNSASQFNRINDFAVTPNGRVLITANNDKQVFFYRIPNIFDPATTTSRIALLTLNGRLTSCNISGDGRYMLLSIAPEELQLWDISPLDTFEKPFLKQKFFGQSQAVYMVRSCFGYLSQPKLKEELVLSGSDDGYIYIWKLETGQLITRVKGHDGLCNSVDWNRFYVSENGPDYGKYWCSVGDDHLVKIWGPHDT